MVWLHVPPVGDTCAYDKEDMPAKVAKVAKAAKPSKAKSKSQPAAKAEPVELDNVAERQLRSKRNRASSNKESDAELIQGIVPTSCQLLIQVFTSVPVGPSCGRRR